MKWLITQYNAHNPIERCGLSLACFVLLLPHKTSFCAMSLRRRTTDEINAGDSKIKNRRLTQKANSKTASKVRGAGALLFARKATIRTCGLCPQQTVASVQASRCCSFFCPLPRRRRSFRTRPLHASLFLGHRSRRWPYPRCEGLNGHRSMPPNRCTWLLRRKAAPRYVAMTTRQLRSAAGQAASASESEPPCRPSWDDQDGAAVSAGPPSPPRPLWPSVWE